jgi:hypothetical protein
MNIRRSIYDLPLVGVRFEGMAIRRTVPLRLRKWDGIPLRHLQLLPEIVIQDMFDDISQARLVPIV